MDIQILKNESEFRAVRSGGPGGQHANKVSSKVVIIVDVENSEAFSEKERKLIFHKLASRINKKNELILSCDETRSQHKNKEIITDRVISLLQKALKSDKKRIPTKVRKSEKTKRLDAKKKLGFKKALRQKPKHDE